VEFCTPPVPVGSVHVTMALCRESPNVSILMNVKLGIPIHVTPMQIVSTQ
jgi:hypothetical protein